MSINLVKSSSLPVSVTLMSTHIASMEAFSEPIPTWEVASNSTAIELLSDQFVHPGLPYGYTRMFEPFDKRLLYAVGLSRNFLDTVAKASISAASSGAVLLTSNTKTR